jgi:hypothetical protein
MLNVDGCSLCYALVISSHKLRLLRSAAQSTFGVHGKGWKLMKDVLFLVDFLVKKYILLVSRPVNSIVNWPIWPWLVYIMMISRPDLQSSLSSTFIKIKRSTLDSSQAYYILYLFNSSPAEQTIIPRPPRKSKCPNPN